MLNRYYEQELNNLRTLAAEFGKRNPALAPLLGSAAAVDSDVERLLEGVAFLTGLVQQRLDDDFPEFSQALAQMLFPHFLRPMPCMTILQYAARSSDGKRVHVPAGTGYTGVPIDGTTAVFRSIMPVFIEPLRLIERLWEHSRTGVQALRLTFRFQSVEAKDWDADSLRFWLGGSMNEASRLYRLLMRDVREVQISSPGQPITRLPASVLKPSGFEQNVPLVPWPSSAHPAWRVLYDYFALPEKLLFVDLAGLGAWRQRAGDQMQVRLIFDELPDWTPELHDSSIVLNATPAVNLRKQNGNPLNMDNRHPAYRVQPEGDSNGRGLVFSVEKVSARDAQGKEIEYLPFSTFTYGQPSYQLRIKPSAVDGGYEHYLSFPYQEGQPASQKTMSVRLLCTDGNRPDGLRLGDIRQPTDSSPAQVECTNILGVTPYRPPAVQGDLLWRVLSHLNANHVTLADRDHLRDLLLLYLPPRHGEGYRDAASYRQIDAIEDVEVKPQRRMVRGMPVEGSAICISCRGDYFSGPGSLYLFGAMLDEFFAGCAALNTFTAVSLQDITTGETLEWPAKIGQHRLL